MICRSLSAVLMLLPIAVKAADQPKPQWHIAEIAGTPTVGKAMIGFSPDGAVFGSTGCNQFSGKIEIGDAGQLILGPLIMTRKACQAPLDSQEQAITKTLSAPITQVYDLISDTVLLISSSDGFDLRLIRADVTLSPK